MDRGANGRRTADSRRRSLAHVQLLDAREVAKILCISMTTLWRYVKQGRIPQPMRLSPRMLRWRLRDIERFVGAEDSERRACVG